MVAFIASKQAARSLAGRSGRAASQKMRPSTISIT